LPWHIAGSYLDSIRGVLEDQPPITWVIPGHERQGAELIVETLQVGEQPPLRFELSGSCASASDFDYRGP
jgi:glyoxylase-like metal-dependent hydrolase (beta-lactamase superfamily II)